MRDAKNKVTVALTFIIIVTAILIVFHLAKSFQGARRAAGGATAAVPSRAEGRQSGGGGQDAQTQRQGRAGEPAPGGDAATGQGGAPRQSGSGAASGGSAAAPAGARGERSGGGQGGGQRTGTAIRVTPVILGTVENSVILSGDVLSSSQVSIYPVMAGKITALRVKAGDRVSRGQTIAMVDPSRPGDSFYASPVTSTVSGVILSVPVNLGETAQTGTVICVVGNLSTLKVETHVPERYVVNIRRGLPAQLSFEAMPGETFAAEVDEMSPVLDPASRTRRITLVLVPDRTGRIDPRILAGMYATISLVTNSRTEVPVIPRVSLINTYGSWIVFVVPSGSGAARRREVALGLESEDLVEIIAGLELGEIVVSAGQNFLSDGDPVRVVE
ncbi:MAG: efflux RND transporter periplasmic adaptor subunit [Treponema sp.]|nr:efflux RND transporter periplasmic adaptor subunit [Treponema sp.]